MRDDLSNGDAARRTPGLTDSQREAFWATFVDEYDALTALVRRHRALEQDARAVVHSAALRLLDAYDRHPHKFAKAKSSRRKILMATVSRYALDCRGRVPAHRPVHRNWGEPILLPPGGRRTPDRPMETVFGTITAEMVRVVPRARDPGELDLLDTLDGILQEARSRLDVEHLIAVDVTFALGHKRSAAARVMRVNVRRYDWLLPRAYANLRRILREMIDAGDIPDHSYWKDVIEAHESRYLARQQRKAELRAAARGRNADPPPAT